MTIVKAKSLKVGDRILVLGGEFKIIATDQNYVYFSRIQQRNLEKSNRISLKSQERIEKITP